MESNSLGTGPIGQPVGVLLAEMQSKASPTEEVYSPEM